MFINNMKSVTKGHPFCSCIANYIPFSMVFIDRLTLTLTYNDSDLFNTVLTRSTVSKEQYMYVQSYQTV